MDSRVSKIDTGICVSFIFSAVIHLAVFLLLAWWGRLYPQQIAVQETYYVDVVTLPTAAPRSGTPAQKPGDAVQVPLPAPASPKPVPPSPKTASKAMAKSVKQATPKESSETESEFAERLAKIEGKAEAQQYEDKLKRLGSMNKSVNNTKVGAPTAGGSEAGSRYADHVKSRLEDALKVTSFYTTKKPEVAVRLTIAADGKLLQMKIERSSGDAAFELAVRRAIELASDKFKAPPNHTVFENGFIFKPKGISSGTSR